MTYTTNRRRFLAQVGATAAADCRAPLFFDVLSERRHPFAGASARATCSTSAHPFVCTSRLKAATTTSTRSSPSQTAWYRDTTYGHGSLALTAAETLPLAGTTYRLHKDLAWLADRWNTVGDVGFALGVGSDQRVELQPLRLHEIVGDGPDHHSRHDRLARSLRRPHSTGQPVREHQHRRPPRRSGRHDRAEFWCCRTRRSSTTSRRGSTATCSSPALRTDGHHRRPGQSSDVAKMIRTTYAVTDRIKGATDPAITGNGTQGYAWITQQLLQVALLVRAGMPSQTYTLGFGRFDSHQATSGMQAARFNELNQGLTEVFRRARRATRARTTCSC